MADDPKTRAAPDYIETPFFMAIYEAGPPIAETIFRIAEMFLVVTLFRFLASTNPPIVPGWVPSLLKMAAGFYLMGRIHYLGRALVRWRPVRFKQEVVQFALTGVICVPLFWLLMVDMKKADPLRGVFDGVAKATIDAAKENGASQSEPVSAPRINSGSGAPDRLE